MPIVILFTVCRLPMPHRTARAVLHLPTSRPGSSVIYEVKSLCWLKAKGGCAPKHPYITKEEEERRWPFRTLFFKRKTKIGLNIVVWIGNRNGSRLLGWHWHCRLFRYSFRLFYLCHGNLHTHLGCCSLVLPHEHRFICNRYIVAYHTLLSANLPLSIPPVTIHPPLLLWPDCPIHDSGNVAGFARWPIGKTHCPNDGAQQHGQSQIPLPIPYPCIQWQNHRRNVATGSPLH